MPSTNEVHRLHHAADKTLKMAAAYKIGFQNSTLAFLANFQFYATMLDILSQM